jgi:hypothetical protein
MKQKNKRGGKEMGKIAAIAAMVIAVFLVFSVPAMATEECVPECTPFGTEGSVHVDAIQHQEHLTEFPGVNNPVTFGHGEQSISACGQGNEITSVEAEAELLQSEPYEAGQELPLGEFEHSGDSLMHVFGSAGTDQNCRTLKIDIENTRCFRTDTSMTGNTMDSSLRACAHLSAEITGAPGTVGFSALNEQAHSYLLERNDGAFQQGFVRTIITSGMQLD